MLTSKYHIGTLIAIFFALGIGILMGGTLGQKWVVHTEDRIVDILMTRYENQLAVNQLLQKQIGSLQLMNQTTAPILQNQKIVWIRPQDTQNELLAFVMKSAGADWMEQNTESTSLTIESAFDPLTAPDIILISDPDMNFQRSRDFQLWSETLKDSDMISKIIDVHPKSLKFNDPKEAVDFMLYLKKITEEDSHAAFGIYRYPSLE